MSVTDDWPEDCGYSPFRLIPWRQACSDLDVSGDTLLKLLAQHKMGVVTLSTRKRGILACDLVRLVRAKARPANTYAVAKEVKHAAV